ncbi:threonine/serine exporter family protein [Clostridium senegalense]|uniref:threonine/serine exporter family protein n=1 Tax=Clostridium senegalense TaxID=1465809 RepID=UPI001C12197B|nr:threonine/serine exporter family protein [Clostridium senegalense]MBU5225678.1 threonine/serine exporter family protein [Clostridium senegalense]
MPQLLLDFIYAFMSTVCFGVIFNIREKHLFFTALGGALSWVVYKYLLFLGYSAVVSMFFGTIAVSMVSEICAKVFNKPVTLYLICGLIPLVPGSGMYYTTFETVKGNYELSLIKGLDTLSYAGSIAVAVILTSTVANLLTNIFSKKRTY